MLPWPKTWPSGKVVIVTGAASGIGLATTQLFLAEGAHLVAEDIHPEIDKHFEQNAWWSRLPLLWA
ncbi:SDR family NAD(P)-dependent oxidoreductase [Acidisarcina polymorpha]|uniref:SDR family NAD(P)-dependent oxidoreductase n=1 Tax=Acidisarcina polymorpha TaxID=2211140 RepID=UPI000DEF6D0D|nr:SDR family NAD(P)-dependent oxidoreductase [Acidisarcina polymorpha]